MLKNVPIEFLSEVKYKPCIKTYFALKANNKSGHYKNFDYKTISTALHISESTLRNHLKELVKIGLVIFCQDKLCLVSVWRNPIINKDRKHTMCFYGKIKKTKIDLSTVKEQIILAKIKTQLNRQKYQNKKTQIGSFKNKIYQKDTIKGRSKMLIQALAENGTISKRRVELNDNEFINYRKGLKLVSGALASHLLMKESKSIGKEFSVSQDRIMTLIGVSSKTTVRKYVGLLEKSGSLSKEIDKPKRVFNKRFNPNKHFKDTFGNIYTKECYRYSIETSKKQSVEFPL